MTDEPAMSDAPEDAAKPAEKPTDSWGETLKTVVYALLIALVIRTFLFQPFNIPSESMEATLLVGDFLFVEKFAYGYSRHSWPFSGWPVGDLVDGQGRVFEQTPQRGDVIVFKMPNKSSPDYLKDYIKRCIGLPGDRVQMIDGKLYLNDKPIPKVRVEDFIETDPFGVVNHVHQYRETLPGGRSYLVLDRYDSPFDTTQVYTVPPGHYFMMGDNRDNSDDSRGHVGYVPAANLVGKAEFRFFSIDDSFVWYKPWTWPGAIRFGRMFTLIT